MRASRAWTIRKRRLNPDFVLNNRATRARTCCVARKNFGCGSSREHAPWALDDYGFRALIAPSYADIFYNNCFKNGLLPIVLSETQVDRIFHDVAAFPGFRLVVDLAAQTVSYPDGSQVFAFEVDAFRKHCLLNGLDEIGLTLQHVDEIKAFETKRRLEQPWLFTLTNQDSKRRDRGRMMPRSVFYRKKNMKIAVLPGDGIGPEIVKQAVKVLTALSRDGLKIEMEQAPIGGAGYDAAQDPLPQATLALAKAGRCRAARRGRRAEIRHAAAAHAARAGLAAHPQGARLVRQPAPGIAV